MNKIFSTGNVFSCNKKNKGKDKISLIYQAHFGAVYALQRNPSFPKVNVQHIKGNFLVKIFCLQHFLTVGDWSAKVWSEDIKGSPIMWTRKIQRKIKLIPSHQFHFSSYTERLTDGCWSPSRPSVFFVTRKYFIKILGLDPNLDVQGGRVHGRLGHPLPAAGPPPVLQGLGRASECCQGDHLVLISPKCH